MKNKCQSSIRPSIYFSLIVKSPIHGINQFVPMRGNFLLKDTTGALDDVQTHNSPVM